MKFLEITREICKYNVHVNVKYQVHHFLILQPPPFRDSTTEYEAGNAH